MLVVRVRSARHATLALAVLAAARVAPAARADRYSDALAHAGRTAADLSRDAIDHPAEVNPAPARTTRARSSATRARCWARLTTSCWSSARSTAAT